MARGDLAVFNDAKVYLIDGGFASTDAIHLGLVSDASIDGTETEPGLDATATTTLTEVAETGAYSGGSELLATLDAMSTQPTAGTMKFADTGPSVTWSQTAGSPTDATYAIVFNDTDSKKRAIAYIDLAGPIDLTAGDLTVTWNASGIFTIT